LASFAFLFLALLGFARLTDQFNKCGSQSAMCSRSLGVHNLSCAKSIADDRFGRNKIFAERGQMLKRVRDDLLPLVYLSMSWQFLHYYVTVPWFYLRLPDYLRGTERLQIALFFGKSPQAERARSTTMKLWLFRPLDCLTCMTAVYAVLIMEQYVEGFVGSKIIASSGPETTAAEVV
jgi:hypothetical protein